MFKRFLRDRRGVTMVEYGIIVGIIAVALIGGMQPVANRIANLLGDNGSALNEALSK